jgi:hypothetical protein
MILQKIYYNIKNRSLWNNNENRDIFKINNNIAKINLVHIRINN